MAEIILTLGGGVGPTGKGVPLGGAISQALVKKSNADYDAEWRSVGGIPDAPNDGQQYVRQNGTWVVLGSVVVPATGISLDITTISGVADNGSTQLTATVAPPNATNKAVSWDSLNPSIASVSNTGLVTRVAAGTTTIRATDSAGHQATCAVTLSAAIIPATGITLNQSTLSGTADNGTTQLVATVTPADATNKTVTWSSSAPTVASVSSTGLVTRLAAGSATITAANSAGQTATCAVSLSAAVIPATGITLDQSTILSSADNGGSQLTATVMPANATNKAVNWSSSIPSVASVDQSGLVTRLTAGTTIITATNSAGQTAQCTVTLTAVVIPATGVTIDQPDSTINVGAGLALTATVAPPNASNQNVTWSSSAPAVASIAPNGLGALVTGLTVGSTTITVTDSAGHTDTMVITVASTAAITPSVVASRVSGVGPLSVFFDASLTTALATSKPFHELEYRWNFGDSDSALWGYGSNFASQSKNRATGAIASHVYETPGTYTAVLTVTDGTNTVSETIQIIVSDPATAYAGALTACISGTGDFNGAPVGATQITNSVYNTALASAIAGGAKRILFHRGENFTLPTTYTAPGGAIGAMTVGAYGTGARPHISATTFWQTFFAGNNLIDWRIMDLEFDGAGMVGTTNVQNVLGVVTTGVNVLALRVYCHDMGTGFMMSGNQVTTPSYTTVQDCQSYNLRGFIDPGDSMMHGCLGFYCSGYNCISLQGSNFDNNGVGEYNVRFQGGVKTIFSHNYCGRGGDGKSSWTLRGNTYLTQYHQISDNIYDSASSVNFPWGVSISPQNNNSNEHIVDAIFERNLLVGGGMYGMLLEASNCTVRNNIFNCLGYVGEGVCLTYNNNTASLPQLSGNNLYNNTFYSSATNNFSGISVKTQGLAILNTTVRNNIAYAPNAIRNGPMSANAPEVLSDFGTGTVESGNATRTQVKTLNPFVGPLPTAVLNSDKWFKLAAGVYAIGAGVAVPVWSDVEGVAIIAASTRNIGAAGLNSAVAATGITLDRSTFAGSANGDYVQLTPTVTPANATNKAVTYVSSNSAILPVTASGLVTRNGPGAATITATNSAGQTATCAFTLAQPKSLLVSYDTVEMAASMGPGVLFMAWVKMDAAHTTTHDNFPFDVWSDSWMIRTVASNWTQTPPLLNNCTMMAAKKVGDTTYTGRVDDFNNVNVPVPNADSHEWTFCAWQFVVSAGGFTLRQWTIPGSVPIYTNEEIVTTASVRTRVVANGGWTTAEANAWTPSLDINRVLFTGGLELHSQTRIKIYARSDKPSLSEILAKSRRMTPDTTAFADFGFEWQAGVPYLTDRSGHGRTLTASTQGNVREGLDWYLPAFVQSAGITLNQSTLTHANDGSRAQLVATITPANASDPGAQWSSSNQAVATVDKFGEVAYVGVGSATITAAASGGQTATCAVTVTAIVPSTGITLDVSALTHSADGTTRQLVVTVLPADATNKGFTCVSSAPAIASVSASGLVTYLAAGSATITATNATGQTATCAITVTAITAITYDFEADTIGTLPADTTNIHGTWTVEDGAAIGWTGKRLRGGGTYDQPYILRLNKFGVTNDQVVTAKINRTNESNYGIGLRNQTEVRGGTYDNQMGINCGYFFQFYPIGSTLYAVVYRVISNDFVMMAGTNIALSTSATDIRCSISGSTLTVEYSTNNRGSWATLWTGADTHWTTTQVVPTLVCTGNIPADASYDNLTFSGA